MTRVLRAIGLLLAAAGLVVGLPASVDALDSTTTVALFYDGAYVSIPGGGECPPDPDPDCEAYAVRQFVEASGAAVNLIGGITETDFANALANANVLVIPELEVSTTLGTDLSPAARQTIADWVASGGRIVFFGGSDPAPTMNAIFGFSVVYDDNVTCLTPCTENSQAAGSEFAGIGNLIDRDATSGLVLSSLPGGSRSPWDNPDDPTVGPVAILPFGTGSVAFIGWDWFAGPPSGTQPGGRWPQVLTAALTPMTVDIAASVTGPADGNAVDCPLEVSAGSQQMRVTWTGTFATGGETFTGSFTLEPNQQAVVQGFSNFPQGDTATVVITVESPFGQTVNNTCTIVFSATQTALPVTPAPVSTPVAVTPAFTG